VSASVTASCARCAAHRLAGEVDEEPGDALLHRAGAADPAGGEAAGAVARLRDEQIGEAALGEDRPEGRRGGGRVEHGVASGAGVEGRQLGVEPRPGEPRRRVIGSPPDGPDACKRGRQEPGRSPRRERDQRRGALGRRELAGPADQIREPLRQRRRLRAVVRPGDGECRLRGEAPSQADRTLVDGGLRLPPRAEGERERRRLPGARDGGMAQHHAEDGADRQGGPPACVCEQGPGVGGHQKAPGVPHRRPERDVGEASAPEGGERAEHLGVGCDKLAGDVALQVDEHDRGLVGKRRLPESLRGDAHGGAEIGALADGLGEREHEVAPPARTRG
jgi:hypothetical protein